MAFGVSKYNFFVRSSFWRWTSDCFWWPIHSICSDGSPERNQIWYVEPTLEISFVKELEHLIKKVIKRNERSKKSDSQNQWSNNLKGLYYCIVVVKEFRVPRNFWRRMKRWNWLTNVLQKLLINSFKILCDNLL